MNTKVVIHAGPLAASADAPFCVDGVGAILIFEGVVRRIEEGRDLQSLNYQAYEPMATRQLQRLADELLTRYCLLGIHVEHSVGVVPVGAVSFRLRIASRHRKEGIAAMDEFIDRMKQDVPLWKSANWADVPVHS